MKTSRKPDEHDKAEGRELARLRRASGLTQEQLALLLGVSPKQIGKYERGQSRLTAGRYKAAMAILRGQAEVHGFAEGQAPYVVPAPTKDMLLQTLRGLQDDLKLCIDVVERL